MKDHFKMEKGKFNLKLIVVPLTILFFIVSAYGLLSVVDERVSTMDSVEDAKLMNLAEELKVYENEIVYERSNFFSNHYDVWTNNGAYKVEFHKDNSIKSVVQMSE